jgi:ribosome modulation factor
MSYNPAASCFQQGRADRRAGKTGKDNPYNDQHNRNRWMDGWLDQDKRMGPSK